MTGKRQLSQTFLLLAGSMIASYSAHAQLGYPVSGLYVGLGAGFNVKGGESIKNITGSIPGSSGLSTPNLTTGDALGRRSSARSAMDSAMGYAPETTDDEDYCDD